MRKVFLSVLCMLVAGIAMAQLEVRSNGTVVFPGNVMASNGGNFLFPGGQDIRFGGDTAGSNSKWSVEYYGDGLNFWKPVGSTNAGDYKVFFSDNGKVSIGSGNTPEANLHVKGFNIRLSPASTTFPSVEMTAGNDDPRIRTGSSKFVFYKMSNTGFANIECGTLTQSSDSTLKTNITKIDEDALTKVCKLNGYSYNWKSDVKGELNSGFIAQEVEKIFPHLVSSNDTSNLKTMNYIGIIPYLVEAIKEQQKQIEELQNELEESKTSSSSTLKSYQIKDENAEDVATLSQNKPNPFSVNTTIEMTIPESVANAMLYIYDLQGKQIKVMTVIGRGATSEIIYGSELQAGLYIYSLVTDGKLVGSKQMILTE